MNHNVLPKQHGRTIVQWTVQFALGHRRGGLVLRVGVGYTGGLEVLVEVGLKGEGLVAPGADVVLVGGMSLHMGPKIGSVSKRLPTMSTSVGLLTCVRAQMTLQQPRARK